MITIIVFYILFIFVVILSNESGIHHHYEPIDNCQLGTIFYFFLSIDFCFCVSANVLSIFIFHDYRLNYYIYV